jgi:AraC-like DNA-binding protein
MQKAEEFTPKINKVYFIECYTLLYIFSGKGSIQVDFKNYFNWKEKAIFLGKGQYIKFLSEDFVVRRIEFDNQSEICAQKARVLFKHLVSLGYVDLAGSGACNTFLSKETLTENSVDIMDMSSKQWFLQNPFKANKEEYQVIFDVKDVIDEQYRTNPKSKDLVGSINSRGYNTQALIKKKIGVTIKGLVSSKKLQESLKAVAFTTDNIQEIAYKLGYKDDAYFCRNFKNAMGLTPVQFRENFDFKNRDLFTQDILELLHTYHKQERALEFYADKMNLSVKALSNKVRAKMNTSLGQLIRLEIVNSAKSMILEGQSITSISRQLGFEEANHFSRFFKHYSKQSPSEFKTKKYHS